MPYTPPTTALTLVSDYVTDARVLLQDLITPYRYDEPSLVIALDVALQDARRVRPDIFLSENLRHGVAKHVGVYSANNEDINVPVEESFRPIILFGMVAHAIMRDEEDVQDSRAVAYRQYFIGGLRGLDT